MSALADTDHAMLQHRAAVAHARDARFWRRAAARERHNGNASDAWRFNAYARNHEAQVRSLADGILAELEQEGVSRTTPPVPKFSGA